MSLGLLGGCSAPFYTEPHFPSTAERWGLKHMHPEVALATLRQKGFVCLSQTPNEDLIECSKRYRDASCTKEVVLLSLTPLRASVVDALPMVRKGCE